MATLSDLAQTLINFKTYFTNKFQSLDQKDSQLTQNLSQAIDSLSSQSQLVTSLTTGKANFIEGSFAVTEQDLQTTQNTRPDQSVVFNTWRRFSHLANTENQPATPSELSTWSYDSINEVINNTTNSSSYIGVVSETKYDTYVLDVKLTSTDNDDDIIGVVIAWDVDPVTGREYTLSVVRTPGGMGPLYGVIYNNYRSDAALLNVASNKVTWGNGQPGSLTQAAAGYVNNDPGWGNSGATHSNTGGVRLYIERIGDIINITTSQWADSDTLDPATLITIDLNTDARLERFKGPRSYGFSSMSQANSTWKVLKFTNPLDSVYDLVNNEVYIFENDEWVIDPTASIDSIGAKSFLYNPATKQLFYFENKDNIFLIPTTRISPPTP